MAARRLTLPGISKLTPLSQGSLSRLCGLYSALNAVQLALYPVILSPEQLQDLYGRGIRHLVRQRQLHRVIGVGMGEEMWLGLTDELAGHANNLVGSALVRKQLLAGSFGTSLTKAIDAIRSTLAAGSPVLIGFWGTLDHYSVVAGFTDQRLLLFDSSGLRWVQVSSLGLARDPLARHRLHPGSTTALIDDW